MKFLLLYIATISYLFSAPAFHQTRDFKNGDGTTFKAKAKGDRYLNWIETEDGEILKYNQESKNFEYAKIEKDQLKVSGEKYEKSSSRKVKSFISKDRVQKIDLYNLWRERRVQILGKRENNRDR